MRWCLIATLTLTACGKKRVEAPAEMEEIARFLYLHFEDDAEAEAGLEKLIDWVIPNLNSDQAKLGYKLTTLTADDTIHITRPDRDPSATLGAAVLATSPYDLEVHARTMALEDQIYANPSNYAFYVRTTSSVDEAAFMAGSGRLDTSNEIETQNFGIRIPYTLQKDYRWIEGDFGRAIIARSHIPESGCASGGENCLMQSYSDDIWIEIPGRPDTIRFTATWNEVVSPATAFITEGQQINALAAGMVRVFENTDSFIADGGVE